MPVSSDESGQAAVQTVMANLGDLHHAGANDTDLIFLKGLMDSPIVKSLVKAHDRLEDSKLEAVSDRNGELIDDVIDDLAPVIHHDDNAAELAGLLREPYFQSLVDTHDAVAARSYKTPPPSPIALPSPFPPFPDPDPIRMVGIRKTKDEPLGLTIKQENDELVIARILQGGAIDKQGLLHVGDIIKEFNGVDVTNDPTKLQELMKDATGSLTLKILPSYQDNPMIAQVFVKCHIKYDPKKDTLIPCQDAGLPFKPGDILQIVDQEDSNWWQARHVDENSPAGLIPSQQLEERRKAFVPQVYDYTDTKKCAVFVTKKKRKTMYESGRNQDFDRHELMIYEEVARMPPFQRKTLVIIGAQGVGRRTLKNKLINHDPTRFGTTMPYTSRPPREGEEDGRGYHFVTKTEMQEDIKAGRFLEFGEYDGNLYGTKIDSIQGIIRAGKMCVLDVNAQCLKTLKTAEFMPHVVFVAAPDLEVLRALHQAAEEEGTTTKPVTDLDLQKTVEESARIQRLYAHYFDLTIVNNNIDEAFNQLIDSVEQLSSAPQWVPVNWVY
ncbi:protein PALS2-like isoform X2 [Ptychodera flava]|uniref:protein PALS2-like isoform X2 n=1 Tax=Ptychodera flava TaxID=63121 RepID=UPI003969BC3C